MEYKRNISIIGCSKELNYAVALKLSRELGISALDTDGLIAYENGLDLGEAITDYGEEFYYRLEKKQLRRLEGYQDTLIATSPTCLSTPSNISALSRYSYTVVLRSSEKDAKKLLISDNCVYTKERLLSNISDIVYALNIYAHQADVDIDATGKSVSEICEEINTKLEEILLKE